MPRALTFGDVTVAQGDDFVAQVELCRPPHNYFDLALIDDLAAALEQLDADPACRAVVLAARGKSFCAGAQLGGERADRSRIVAENSDGSPRHLYDAVVRLFGTAKPIVAAIQGPAVGGGLGLALVADFRVAAPEARFTANFARLGFHHGFGLSVTLPELCGRQRALELLYTGRRIHADEALEIGLVDRIAPQASLREAAAELAREIAASAPLAVRSIRETLRGDLPERIRIATARERAEQERLQKTGDFIEGVTAMAERRTPRFREG